MSKFIKAKSKLILILSLIFVVYFSFFLLDYSRGKHEVRAESSSLAAANTLNRDFEVNTETVLPVREIGGKSVDLTKFSDLKIFYRLISDASDITGITVRFFNADKSKVLKTTQTITDIESGEFSVLKQNLQLDGGTLDRDFVIENVGVLFTGATADVTFDFKVEFFANNHIFYDTNIEATGTEGTDGEILAKFGWDQDNGGKRLYNYFNDYTKVLIYLNNISGDYANVASIKINLSEELIKTKTVFPIIIGSGELFTNTAEQVFAVQIPIFAKYQYQYAQIFVCAKDGEVLGTVSFDIRIEFSDVGDDLIDSGVSDMPLSYGGNSENQTNIIESGDSETYAFNCWDPSGLKNFVDSIGDYCGLKIVFSSKAASSIKGIAVFLAEAEGSTDYRPVEFAYECSTTGFGFSDVMENVLYVPFTCFNPTTDSAIYDIEQLEFNFCQIKFTSSNTGDAQEITTSVTLLAGEICPYSAVNTDEYVAEGVFSIGGWDEGSGALPIRDNALNHWQTAQITLLSDKDVTLTNTEINFGSSSAAREAWYNLEAINLTANEPTVISVSIGNFSGDTAIIPMQWIMNGESNAESNLSISVEFIYVKTVVFKSTNGGSDLIIPYRGDFYRLPESVTGGSGVFVGWTVESSDHYYFGGTVLPLLDQVSPFYPVTIDFSMTPGASVKVLDNAGIRFRSLIEKEMFDILNGGGFILEVGTIVMPTQYLDSGLDFTIENFPNGSGSVLIKNTALGEFEDDNTKYQIVGRLANLKETNYALSFSARGYIKLKDTFGCEYYIYTPFNIAQNSRSMYEVSQNIIEKGTTVTYEDALTKYIDGVADLNLNASFEVTKNYATANYTIASSSITSDGNVSNIVLNTADYKCGTLVLNGTRILSGAGLKTVITINGVDFVLSDFNIKNGDSTTTFEFKLSQTEAYVTSVTPAQFADGVNTIVQTSTYRKEYGQDEAKNVLIPADAVNVFGLGMQRTVEDLRYWKEAIKNAGTNQQINVFLALGRDRGDYYIDGIYDGSTHYDIVQKDINGDYLVHPDTAVKTHYVFLSKGYAEYLAAHAIAALDELINRDMTKQNTTAIYFEEPDGFTKGVYGDYFKEKYQEKYGEVFDSNTVITQDVRYKIDKLITEITAAGMREIVKNIKAVYPDVPIYFCTHTSFSYVEGPIASNNAEIINLTYSLDNGETVVQCIDGFVVQSWTDTSSVAVKYDGVTTKKVFEVSYAEYSELKSIQNATGKKMYALVDASCDNPAIREGVEETYLQNIVAQMLQPDISYFQISIWPDRSFYSADDEYRTIQQSIFTMSNDVAGKEAVRTSGTTGVAVLMSHTSVSNENAMQVRNYIISTVSPLLEQGIPCDVILLETMTEELLQNYHTIIGSYNYFKPESADQNELLSEFVNKGGSLIWLGAEDNNSAYTGFWGDTYTSPRDHLFAQMGITQHEQYYNTSVNITKGNAPTYFSEYKNDSLYVDFAEIGSQTGKSVTILNYEYDSCNLALLVLDPYGEGNLLRLGIDTDNLSDTAELRELFVNTVRYGIELAEKEYVATKYIKTVRGDYTIIKTYDTMVQLKGMYVNIFGANLTVLINPIIQKNSYGIYKKIDTNSGSHVCFTNCNDVVSEINDGYLTFNTQVILNSDTVALVYLPTEDYGQIEITDAENSLVNFTCIFDDSTRTLKIIYKQSTIGGIQVKIKLN